MTGLNGTFLYPELLPAVCRLTISIAHGFLLCKEGLNDEAHQGGLEDSINVINVAKAFFEDLKTHNNNSFTLLCFYFMYGILVI